MPTPPECQPIADALANLSAQEQAQRDVIQSLTGIDKWKAIEALGTIRQNISEQQLLLTQCIKDHAADFSTQIIVYDVSGSSGPNRIARLWQLTGAGQAVKQTTTVQAGAATLSGVSGPDRQSFGITIEEIDHPTVCGPDFRSVLLPGVEDPQRFDPTVQIEIVILDPITLGTDSLTVAAPPLPIQLSCAAGPFGTVNILVNSLNLVVDSGRIVLTAAGTATSGFNNSTFSFVNAFHIVPTFKMAPSSLVDILSGVPPVISMTGLVGNFVQDIAPLLSAKLTDQAITPIAALLNRIISNEVAGKLGLTSLPSGSVLSVREVSASASGITVVPVLGAFGTVLSDFQPSPQRLLPRLVDLGLQPSSIATGDPTTNATQGKLTLDGPAPVGGVAVQLSCDRSDLLRLDPAALMIPEGALTGTFTATGMAPSITSSTPADVIVSASLEGQTISAHVSIRPENPATTVPNSGTIFTLPAAKMEAAARAAAAEPRPIGIQDFQLDTPIITRGSTVHGQVVLDAILNVTEMIHISFDPYLPPTYFTIPPQTTPAPAGFFSFVVAPSFPGDSLTITARVHSSDVKRSIHIPVAS